jgi:hypothetical protein
MSTDNSEHSEQPEGADGASTTRQQALTRRISAGQVMDKITRRIPPGGQPPQRQPRSGQPASRERIAALVAALGDPSHSFHSIAVDELVAIGPAAVSALNEVIDPQQPWLSAYRAAEAAGRIGDGRAAGALMRALQHPNSNVRWSAVRALTQVGDLRAALELRRVAERDQGRTSWGESVASTAESALAHMRERSVWGQSFELIKTAVTAVLMILALILAFSVVTTLRDDLDRFGQVDPALAADQPLLLPTITATAALPTVELAPILGATTVGAEATPPALESSTVITGTVLQEANVRPQPITGNQPIGRVLPGTEVIFIARSTDGQWYLVQLGPRPGAGSRIDNPDGSGTGWVNRALLTPPEGDLPTREVEITSNLPSAEPTATP